MRILTTAHQRRSPHHEFLTFEEVLKTDPADGSQVFLFEDIIRNLPTGWTPDIVLCPCPMFHPIPIGIEKSPWPTVIATEDWFGSIDYLLDSFRLFDVIVASDRVVERLLKQNGFNNVIYCSLSGHYPERFKLLEGLNRNIDIFFAGNLNINVQSERQTWLERVILEIDQDRYRVLVAEGLVGDNYVHMLNRSRIVFNRSIKGEANFRVFESIACGALLFLEEENLEIRDYLEPGLEVILYNAENLIDQLHYYLEHEDKRAAIAEAGLRKITYYTFTKFLDSLFDMACRMIVCGAKRSIMPLSYAVSTQHRDFMHTAYSRMPLQKMFDPSHPLFSQGRDLLKAHPNDPLVLNDVSVAMITGLNASRIETGASIESLAGALTSIKNDLNHALLIRPNYIVAQYNLAEACLIATDIYAAFENYKKVLEMEALYPEDLSGSVHPYNFHNSTRYLWSTAFSKHWEEPLEWMKIRLNLIKGVAAFKVSSIASLLGLHDEANQFMYKALKFQPDNAYLALNGLMTKRIETPEEVLHAAYLTPFNTESWCNVVELLAEKECIYEAIYYAETRLRVLNRYLSGNKNLVAIRDQLIQQIVQLHDIEPSPQFKAKIACAAIEAKMKPSEISRIFKVDIGKIEQWKKQLQDNASSLFLK